MKKLIFLTAQILLCITCFAQERFDAMHDKSFLFDLMHILGALTCLTLVATLLLKVLRTVFDLRIKSRLIENQSSRETIEQLLRQDLRDDRKSSLKWVFILVGIGLSLFFMTVFETPLPISLAILCFGLSAGLSGYYFFTKNTRNK